MELETLLKNHLIQPDNLKSQVIRNQELIFDFTHKMAQLVQQVKQFNNKLDRES